MKKIALSLVTLIAVGTVVVQATRAVFSDTETSTGNTFSAGSIDLTVDDVNDPITAKFLATNMKPGSSYDTGCVTLKNVGTLDGVLTMSVNNLKSNENTLVEPEASIGDVVDTEIDPDGYHGNTGDGELWDQITTQFCVEAGAGSHSTNRICDWDDAIIKGFSSTQDDYSSVYSIPQNTDLANGKNIVIPAGESKTLCSGVKFIDDTSNSWWGGQGSLKNNHAMTDDAQMDIIFGLKQVDVQ